MSVVYQNENHGHPLGWEERNDDKRNSKNKTRVTITCNVSYMRLEIPSFGNGRMQANHHANAKYYQA